MGRSKEREKEQVNHIVLQWLCEIFKTNDEIFTFLPGWGLLWCHIGSWWGFHQMPQNGQCSSLKTTIRRCEEKGCDNMIAILMFVILIMGKDKKYMNWQKKETD